MADKTDNKPAKDQKPKEQKAPAKEAKSGGAEKRMRAGKGEGGGIVLEKTDTPKASAGKARLREKYLKEVVPALTKEFSYKNPNAVPKVKKVSLNIGLGEATGNSKLMDGAVNEMAAIAGQKPVVTKARKSIAAFKLREGMPIGCMVTLRGDRMFEFLDRLMNVALPRVRDFRGVSPKSFDGRGNYTLGLKDQLIFPEIDYNKVEKTKGMNISITTSAKTDAEGLALLKQMGMPFRQ
jgi:large subunit ribosomal protein L5